MGLLYGTSDSGSVLWPLVFKPNGMQPVDNRTVVGNETDLNIKTTFKDKYYLGMQVYVVENKTLYILTGETDTGVWTKLPSQDDLTKALETNKKELFTFKGVASAIDADRCTITKGYATVKDGDGSKFMIKQQAYDILKETMYGWESDEDNNVYWTHEITGTELSPVYIRGSQQYISYLIYKGDAYYLTSSNIYESLDGNHLYQSGDSYYLDAEYTQAASGVTSSSYHGYQFTVVADTILTLAPDGGGESASDKNIGHVYQIGEEEYASNGSIWVQLGSPKEDWIVIK